MALLVTAHAYSQRRNPSWILSDAQEDSFSEILRGMRERSPVKARGGIPIFGYRGFAVTQLPGAEPAYFVNRGIVDPGSHELSFLDENRSMETFLLSTAGSGVDETLKEEIRESLQESFENLLQLHLRRLQDETDCPNVNIAADAPDYNPSPWNSVDSVRGNNNCYNYANDKPLGNSAIPGP